MHGLRLALMLHNFNRKALSLFESYEESLLFTQDYDLDVQQIVLLENTGRKAEAAEIHLSEGRLKEAIGLFISDTANPLSARRAVDCILYSLWDTFFFGMACNVEEQNHSIGIEFLEIAIGLSKKHAEDAEITEASCF